MSEEEKYQRRKGWATYILMLVEYVYRLNGRHFGGVIGVMLGMVSDSSHYEVSVRLFGATVRSKTKCKVNSVVASKAY